MIKIENRKLTISGDAPLDYVEIDGVLISFELFCTFVNPRSDRLYQLKREGEVVIVTDRGPAPPPESFHA